jgi:hypothetical protein
VTLVIRGFVIRGFISVSRGASIPIRGHGQDTNPGPPKYEAGLLVLKIRPQPSVSINVAVDE